MINEILYSRKSDEWETPIELFNDLNNEFNFTLDPCCTNQNHKCAKYYTLNDNGLLMDWSNEVVFCNPPYHYIDKWVEKCYRESLKDNTIIVMLIPVRTDTKYFHNYIYHRAEIRFIKGRLHFNNSKNSAPFPSMIVIFRGANLNHEDNEFCENESEEK